MVVGPYLLFAQFKLDELSRAFRTPNPLTSIVLGMLLLLIFGGLVLFYLRSHQVEERKHIASHPKLFRELSDAHKLSSEERGRLKELARIIRARHADYMFVRFDLMDQAIELWQEMNPDESAEPLRALRRRLFEPLPQSPSASVEIPIPPSASEPDDDQPTESDEIPSPEANS